MMRPQVVLSVQGAMLSAGVVLCVLFWSGAGPASATPSGPISFENVDIQTVSFKATPTIYTDMMAERIDMMLALMPSALPQIKGGKLRGLGVSGPRRSPAIPDTPTIREAGVPFAQTFWAGLSAPKGTPAEAVEKLHAAVQKVVADPEVQAWAVGAGAEMRGGSSAEFAAHMREQTAVWTKLVNDLGLKAE